MALSLNRVLDRWLATKRSAAIGAILAFGVVSTVYSAVYGTSGADEKLLIEVFKIKNPGVNIRKYSNKSLVAGTVPARAVGFAEDSRIKATLGCYQLVYSMPGDPIETDTQLCIYYIEGPDGGGGKVWWRGNAESLQGLMANQDFQT
jgi:hypothetical protein